MKALLLVLLVLPLINCARDPNLEWKVCYNHVNFLGIVDQVDGETCYKWACLEKKLHNCQRYFCKSVWGVWKRSWCDTLVNEEDLDVDLASYDGNEEGYSNSYMMLAFGFGAGLGFLGMMYKRTNEGTSHLVEIAKM